MIVNEKWVALTTYYWNQNGADVVCKQLGYSDGADEVVTTNRYLPDLPRAPFYMRVVSTNMLRLSLSSASDGLSLPPIKWPFYLPLHCLS